VAYFIGATLYVIPTGKPHDNTHSEIFNQCLSKLNYDVLGY